MQRFKTLPIGAQIFLGLALVILLAVGAVAVNVTLLAGFHERLTFIVEQNAEALRLTARVNQGVTELRIAGKDLLLSNSQEETGEAANRLRNAQRDLDLGLGALDRLILTPAGRARVETFREQYRAYLGTLDRIKDLIAAGRTHEAIEFSRGEGLQRATVAMQAMAALVEETEQSLAAGKRAGDRAFRQALWWTLLLMAVMVGLSLLVTLYLSRMLSRNVGQLRDLTAAIAAGDLERPLGDMDTRELRELAGSVARMQTALREVRDHTRAEDWLKTGLGRLNQVMTGDPDLNTLAARVIAELATTLEAPVGLLYVTGEGGDPTLSLLGSYAFQSRKHLANRFAPGEGLVGQCALERQPILVRNCPDGYVKLSSGLGEAVPRCLYVTPFRREDRVKGVVELGLSAEPTPIEYRYLEQAMPGLAAAVESAHSRTTLASTLQESQRLAAMLQTQQEELKTANEELEEQTQLLRASEEQLRVQQEELRVSNEELAQKNQALERQKLEIGRTNADLSNKRAALEEQARALATASKYKSEFLANMSHELRTPLNSLLLLAGALVENREGNLTDDQVESARIIERSGNDLLSLINEILDLARIEAGRTELHPEPVVLADLARGLQEACEPLAQDKGLALRIDLTADAPQRIVTDRKRLEQVLRNFLSNAVKFTGQGGVTVTIEGAGTRAGAAADLGDSGLDPAQAIAITVADTGIGIPADKHAVIFEAFQQADGGTARRYGGTGLGLAISRNLSRILGGVITLASAPGEGSRFTLYLPIAAPQTQVLNQVLNQAQPGTADGVERPRSIPSPGTAPPHGRRAAAAARPAAIADDRESLRADGTTILVVEDDPGFAQILVEQCHGRGFKALVAATGEEGLALAGRYLPQGIILDIRLPGIDGWAVLAALKDNPETRHIPIHVMSGDDSTIDALHLGAIGFLQKPVNRAGLDAAFARLEHVFSRRIKDLLVVEDDTILRAQVVRLIASDDVQVAEADTGQGALQRLHGQRFDCMILDLGLPDMTGFDLLKTLAADPAIVVPPVIVYTGRELTRAEEAELRIYAESIIVKGVKSPERLLDETSLFLHRVVGGLPERARRMIADLHDPDRVFKDRTVLLVDDDMRNVFALSKTLESKGLKVRKAEDGIHALALLDEDDPPDLVIMDIMMPGMDGYETMRRIRAQPRYERLPIIALTAKAMKEDCERCIAAGADDYLTKPVDLNRLYSMLRVWLYR